MVVFSTLSPSSISTGTDSELDIYLDIQDDDVSTLSSGEAHSTLATPEEISCLGTSALSEDNAQREIAGFKGLNSSNIPNTTNSTEIVEFLGALLKSSVNKPDESQSAKSKTTLNYGLNMLPSSQTTCNELQFARNHVFRLMDLPPELVLIVFEYCDLKTLHALTATSRSTCDIAFPVLCAVSDLAVPKDDPYVPEESPPRPQAAGLGMIDITTPEQALALLVWKRHQTFRCIGVLSFVLEQSTDQTAILVDRSLSVFESPMPLQAPFATMINIFISSVENVSAEASRLIYGLQNSSCNRLSITGYTRTSDILSVDSDMPLMVPTDTGYNNLEIFHVCGFYPFLPHMLPFTMCNLLNKNLRELELNMNGFCLGKWARFLPALSFYRLESLDFGGSISSTSALKFLRRHQRLRKASFCGISTPFSTPRLHKGFKLMLPDLEYLRAPCLYLSEILKHITHPYTSGLSRISILTDFHTPYSFGNSSTFRRTSVATLLSQVQKFQNLTKLEFHFDKSGNIAFSDTSKDVVPPETLLYFVDTISIYKCTGPPLDNKVLVDLIDWITLFPEVSSVEFWEAFSIDRSEWMSALRSKGITPIVHNAYHSRSF